MRKFLLTFVVLVAGAMSAWADGVAKIGDETYPTLAEAVAAAQNDETITMLQDVILGAAVKVEGKTITLDLNGKTVNAPSSSAFVAKEGAEVAKTARDDFERRLGRSVVSPERAIDHLNPSGSLPLNEIGEFGE